jgi:PAS domain-containing protein
MDWMTARLALETRLSQVDDDFERQREELEALGAELGRVAARYDRLARSELFGYAVTTLDGWLVHCNDAFARLLGYGTAREALASASEHAFGAHGADVISPAALSEDHVRYRDAWLTRVDGVSVRVLQSALLVTGHGQDPLVERVFLDLSDRMGLEERLRSAQRLETLGRLTAAMAPELDALAALVEAGVSAPPDPHADIAEVVTPSATVLEIRQLLAFIRKQSRPASLIDLNEAVERIAPMLARLVSSHVEFTVQLGPTALVAADEEDFEQMATALVVAARDRLAAGGTLSVETGAVDLVDSDRRPAIGVRSGSGAVVTVTAAGYGVQLSDPPSTLESVVDRCGGTLHIGGLAGRRVTLRVHLPKIR